MSVHYYKILFMLGISLLFLSPTRSSNELLKATPVDDVKITVYATGNLQGKFNPDNGGQGGLAALHTLIERTRRRHNIGSGEVFLFHTGIFSGTENQNGFNEKVGNSEFNLIDYMKYDALLLPEKERTQAMVNKISAACPENTELKNNKTDFFIKHVKKRNTGIDILCVSKDSEMKNMADTLALQKESHLFFILSSLNGSDILPANSLREDLPEQSIAQKTFIFQSHEKNNYFRRSESGSFICNTGGQTVCELEIVLRSGHIISVQQRFIVVNGRDMPLPNYAADIQITEFLTKNSH